MRRSLLRNQDGATVVEFAFVLPVLIIAMQMIVELGLVFRANSGIQHALGEGARFATLFPKPGNEDILKRMDETVDGIGPGKFTPTVVDPPDDPATPANESVTLGYKDLTVSYEQQTSLLLFPGPKFRIVKNKRVWTAA